MRHFISLCAAMLLLSVTILHAQVGTWQTLTDMQNVRDIVVSDVGIMAASSGGVFVEGDGGFTRYTNVDGLSDIDYTAVTAIDGGMVVGSSAGMLNIRTSEKWISVTDIARATQYSRRGITWLGTRASLLYIGTEFGLAVYDVGRQEFGDTYTKFGALPAQSAVRDVLLEGTRIWVATENGVATADLDNPNLKDPANWTSYTVFPGSGDADVQAIASFGGRVVAATSGILFEFTGTDWQERHTLPGGSGSIRALAPRGSELLVLTTLQLMTWRIGEDARTVGDRLDNGAYPAQPRFTDVHVVDAAVHLSSTAGITAYVEGSPWTFRKPEGPGSNFFKSLVVDVSGMLWGTSGLSDGGRGFYRFDGARWRNYLVATDPDIKTNNMMYAAVAGDGTLWFSTRGTGVLSLSPDGAFGNYGPANVPGFPGVTVDANYPSVEGIAVDSKGTVWTLHNETNTSHLGCRTADGSWYFFRLPSAPTGLYASAMTMDQFGAKWGIFTSTPTWSGLFMHDDNGTPALTGDDRFKWFPATDANGINATDLVTAVEVDRLGDVWIGTDRGIRTIFNPQVSERISKTCFNTRCNVEGLYITSVAVDPVNNKWLGSKDGVFVLSPDGSEIIAQYDTRNSPLLDNEIIDIVVHPSTGVAYIATRRGLSSLSTPYAQPNESFGEIRVAPNPYRHSVDDRVLIDGLVEGSIIKVLTVAGDLVVELPSPGGRVGFWDGRDAKGAPVPSGVYFIVAASANGKQAGVAKIAVIRD